MDVLLTKGNVFENDKTDPFDQIVSVDDVVLILLLLSQTLLSCLFDGSQSSVA